MRICVYFIFYGMFSSLDRGFYVLLTISFQSYIVLSVSFYLFFFFIYSQTCLKQPQWVKRWPTDVAVRGSIPALDVNLSNRKRGSIAYTFSLSSYHRPDIIVILLKRT